MNFALTVALGWSLVASALAQAPSPVTAETVRPTSPSPAKTTVVVLPESVPDPIEPINRVVFNINRGILIGVVKPTAKVYRLLVIKPIRTGIGHFGRNITFPGA